MAETFFITTAIDYTNSAPHIGHAYEKVLADVIARYHRLKGDNVFFLTGVDQHGQKVQQSAAKDGVPPAEFVKGITQKFVDLWEKLDVRYDRWAATTDPLHKKCVQGILQRLWDEKQIYKDKQAGYYSIRQEQFLTDKERGPHGKFGPEWGEVEFREEENYYFKLSDYKDWLLGFLKSHSDFVIPTFRQAELVTAVEKIGSDLCISRPKSRLDWGIELPFDNEFVNYVWFDALTNYISFVGYDPKIGKYEDQSHEFRGLWSNARQVIGKDILIPAHGIYWPIMLKALDFPDDQMPKLLVHGWWNVSGAKISKSEGNVIDPDALAGKYSAETLRYYLMSDIATGSDADFSEERLIVRYSSDLGNKIGNLLNRTLTMTHRYQDGRLRQDLSGGLRPRVEYFVKAYCFCLDEFAIGGALDQTEGDPEESNLDQRQIYGGLGKVVSLAMEANRYVEQTSPWNLAKSNSIAQLNSVLYHLAESVRVIAILISPVLPKAAHGIFDQLNWKMELSGKQERFSLGDAEFGKLPDGHVVGKPVLLFPRIEL